MSRIVSMKSICCTVLRLENCFPGWPQHHTLPTCENSLMSSTEPIAMITGDMIMEQHSAGCCLRQEDMFVACPGSVPAGAPVKLNPTPWGPTDFFFNTEPIVELGPTYWKIYIHKYLNFWWASLTTKFTGVLSIGVGNCTPKTMSLLSATLQQVVLCMILVAIVKVVQTDARLEILIKKCLYAVVLHAGNNQVWRVDRFTAGLEAVSWHLLLGTDVVLLVGASHHLSSATITTTTTATVTTTNNNYIDTYIWNSLF